MSTFVKHEASLRRVCVWFGTHQVVKHIVEPAYAVRFEGAMRRRFASLRVTNEPAEISDADRP